MKNSKSLHVRHTFMNVFFYFFEQSDLKTLPLKEFYLFKNFFDICQNIFIFRNVCS